MEELVLLKYEAQTGFASVKCPKCGRISTMKVNPSGSSSTHYELSGIHRCPVCLTDYRSCSINHHDESSGESRIPGYSPKEFSQNGEGSGPASATSDTPDSAGGLQRIRPATSVFNIPVVQRYIPEAPAAIDSWQKLFTYIILERGRFYYRQGRVRELMKTGTSHRAIVMGTEKYTVTISYAGNAIASLACNCPYAQSGKPCKHMAAVLFAAHGDPNSQEENKTVLETRGNDVPAPVEDTAAWNHHTADFHDHSSVSSTGIDFALEQELNKKIGLWKRELLDTGMRNKMINFKQTKRSTLKITSPKAEELFKLLAEKEKTLTFQKPISKETDIRTYSLISLMETLSYSLPATRGDIKTEGTIVEQDKTLKNLRSKAKLAQEEQGTNILYLCFGFICWNDHTRSSSPGKRSPLLMMPVNLGLKSLNAPYTLSKSDDEIEVNPTLAYLFSTEYNIELPPFEKKDSHSFTEYLRKVEEIVEPRGWRVIPEVSLGLLSFLKISMYHDLNNNHEKLLRHPVIRAMAGDESALAGVPASVLNYDFDQADPRQWHEVVNADSSQEEAILLSKMGVSFVMQGPPGTGKSQTITNIIAEALADGKKVLFVSEKAAALQVVLKRLTEAGLADFCLSLHNYKANKKDIIQSIWANLNLQKEYGDESALWELNRLFQDRKYLGTYARELHRPVEPLGESIYEAFGKLSGLETASIVDFTLDQPLTISRDQYNSMTNCIRVFEKALHNLKGPLSQHPWFETRAVYADQTYKRQLLAGTGDLARELEEMIHLAAELKELLNTDLPLTWQDLERSSEELVRILALPLFSSHWLEPEVRTRMLAAAAVEQQEQEKFRAACAAFSGALDPSVLEAPLDSWQEMICKGKDSLEKLGFKTDDAPAPFSTAAARQNTAAALSEELTAFLEQYQMAERAAGSGEPVTFTQAARFHAFFNLFENSNPYIHPSWFDLQTQQQLSIQLQAAKIHASSLQQTKSAISAKWMTDVFKVDAHDLAESFQSQAWMDERTGDPSSLLESEISEAKELLSQMNRILEAAGEASSLLHYFPDCSIDQISRLHRVLSFIAEAPCMEADWFDSRKNGEIMPLIEKAMQISRSVQEKSEALLREWEPGVFSMDAAGMLARFKTEYTGLFRKMKASYKEDIKTIKLNAKAVGKTIDEPQIISLLQNIQEMTEQKKWFDAHSSELKELAGRRYRGLDTDWAGIHQSIQTALNIAALFPYESVPEETILSLCQIVQSPRLTGEARRICDILCAIPSISQTAAASKYLSGFSVSSLVDEEILPQIQDFLEKGKKQRLYIDQFQNARKTPGFTCHEVRELLSSLILIRQEEEWFESHARIHQPLFADLYKGSASSWESIEAGLEQVRKVQSVFAGDCVPAAAVQYACKPDGEDHPTLKINLLDPLKIEEFKKTLSEIAPHWNVKQLSVPEIMDLLKNYVDTAQLIQTLQQQMARYSLIDTRMAEDLFVQVVHAQEARSRKREIEKRAGQNSELFGLRYKGIETDWVSFIQDIKTVEKAVAETGPFFGTDALALVSDQQTLRSQLGVLQERLTELLARTRPEIIYFQEQFTGIDFTVWKLEDLARRYDACLNGFGELNKWLDYIETRRECNACGLADFTFKIAAADNSIYDVEMAFKRGFYQQWIPLALAEAPAVENFRRRVHEQKIEQFIQTDERQFALSRQRIRDRIIDTYPKSYELITGGKELRILRREVEKKRRIMPLRKFLNSIPHLLLTLKPCLMMSPLSVAYFLKAGSYEFDLVIFDEASQIFPQDAIGAIMRARQVVVAGDTKQLPPTSFFSSSTSNSDNEFDSEDDDEMEVYDSILEETANILPNKMLLWHYRSRHENLIAFSNQEIYQGELVTFPSSNERERDTGVEFIYVEDGYYEGGGKNCNIPEAEKIVQLIQEHFDRYPDRSLGVIAFSEKQQNAIALQVQRFRQLNTQYESFFAEGKEDEFFIKNLENVQGDERDTIIFSIGYARTREQKLRNKPMAMRFGPLGIQGGERRLNVAITRAKINVKLVGSILLSDIDPDRTKSEGIRMLRSYIEFAMNGSTALAAKRSRGKTDAFADTIAQYLEDHGCKVQKHVGCSDSRIDIAVEHPSQIVHQFAAGIECDGYSYASSKTVRDRDRLRGSVLKNRGWNMYRVWSAEWYKNPEVEGEKLLAFIDSAIKACDQKVKILEEEKRKDQAAATPLESTSLPVQPKEPSETKDLPQAAEENENTASRLWAQPEKTETPAKNKTPGRDKKWESQVKDHLNWAQPGVLVHHKTFGDGTIQRIERGYITVSFSEEEKRFKYPSVFEKGYLVNPQVSKEQPGDVQAGISAEKKSRTAFLQALTAQGFTCIDHYQTSGIIWVLYRADLKANFEKTAAAYDVQFTLEKRGALATKDAPAWRTMFK